MIFFVIPDRNGFLLFFFVLHLCSASHGHSVRLMSNQIANILHFSFGSIESHHARPCFFNYGKCWKNDTPFIHQNRRTDLVPPGLLGLICRPNKQFQRGLSKRLSIHFIFCESCALVTYRTNTSHSIYSHHKYLWSFLFILQYFVAFPVWSRFPVAALFFKISCFMCLVK